MPIDVVASSEIDIQTNDTIVGKRNLAINFRARSTTNKIYVPFHEFFVIITQL